MYKLFILLVLLTIAISCSKEEGKGGSATITGKVKIKDYDGTFKILWEEYYAPDEDVYIIYGDDSIYSDDFKTNYDGSYEFKYLRPGTYTIYALSKDTVNKTSWNTPTEKMIPVKKIITVSDKKETIIAEDIIIIN